MAGTAAATTGDPGPPVILRKSSRPPPAGASWSGCRMAGGSRSATRRASFPASCRRTSFGRSERTRHRSLGVCALFWLLSVLPSVAASRITHDLAARSNIDDIDGEDAVGVVKGAIDLLRQITPETADDVDLGKLHDAQNTGATASQNTIPNYHTNFCARHKLVDEGRLNLSEALDGMDISVALFDYQLDDELDAGRLLLDEISSRAGFTWSYTKIDSPPDGAWETVLFNATERYDLMGEWYTQKTDRLARGIIFPEGWYDASKIMVMLKDEKTSYDPWALFLPFDGYLWLLIVGTIIVSALLLHLMNNIENHKSFRSFAGISDALSVSAFTFIGQFFREPETNAARIFSFSMCFLSLTLLAAYTANLASILIIENQVASTIENLGDALRQRKRLCVLNDSSALKIVLERYPDADGQIVRTSTMEEDFSFLDHGNCDIALLARDTWEKNKQSSQYNKGCKKHWVGREVSVNSAGYSIKESLKTCSSLLRDVLDFHLIDMKENDGLQRILENSRRTKYDLDCNADSNEALQFQIGVKDVSGVFIIHAIALVTGLALSCGNFLYKKGKRHRSTDTRSTSDSLIEELMEGRRTRRISMLPGRRTRRISMLPVDNVRNSVPSSIGLGGKDEKLHQALLDTFKRQLQLFEELAGDQEIRENIASRMPECLQSGDELEQSRSEF